MNDKSSDSKSSFLHTDEKPLEFNFDKSMSEASLGNYLRSVFSSGSVPEAISNHFTSTAPIPKDLIGHQPTGSVSSRRSGIFPSGGLSGPQTAMQRDYLTPVRDDTSQQGQQTASQSAGPHLPPLQTLTDGVAQSSSTPATSSAELSAATTPVHQLHHQLQVRDQQQTLVRQQQQQQQQHHQHHQEAEHTEAGAGALSIVAPVSDGGQYCDITEYLNMPQSQAAKKLGIPPSTLSKRWKEAARNRKWPWRTTCKIDKEITTLLHNIPPGGAIPEEIEANLAMLLRRRSEELKPVVIRL